jgi:hypothetical protein
MRQRRIHVEDSGGQNERSKCACGHSKRIRSN